MVVDLFQEILQCSGARWKWYNVIPEQELLETPPSKRIPQLGFCWISSKTEGINFGKTVLSFDQNQLWLLSRGSIFCYIFQEILNNFYSTYERYLVGRESSMGRLNPVTHIPFHKQHTQWEFTFLLSFSQLCDGNIVVYYGKITSYWLFSINALTEGALDLWGNDSH